MVVSIISDIALASLFGQVYILKLAVRLLGTPVCVLSLVYSFIL